MLYPRDEIRNSKAKYNTNDFRMPLSIMIRILIGTDPGHQMENNLRTAKQMDRPFLLWLLYINDSWPCVHTLYSMVYCSSNKLRKESLTLSNITHACNLLKPVRSINCIWQFKGLEFCGLWLQHLCKEVWYGSLRDKRHFNFLATRPMWKSTLESLASTSPCKICSPMSLLR